MSSYENLSPQIIQRVAKEIRQLAINPPDGIKYLPNEDENMSEILAEIQGPEKTPYESGYFKLKLVLSDGFPTSPPKGYFLTKIFHPNISLNGDICVNTLKKDWTPDLGIIHVLQVIRCLLIVPFPESSLNDEAGKLFMDSYDEYARRAKLLTTIHALKKSSLHGTKCNEKSSPETSNEPNSIQNLKEEQIINSTHSLSNNLKQVDTIRSSSSARQRNVKKKGLKRL